MSHPDQRHSGSSGLLAAVLVIVAVLLVAGLLVFGLTAWYLTRAANIREAQARLAAEQQRANAELAKARQQIELEQAAESNRIDATSDQTRDAPTNSNPAAPHGGTIAKGPIQSGKLVDLTHPFNEQTIYWPTEDGFQLIRGPAGVTERGYFYAANRFTAAEHGGTHIDAPIHFFESGLTVDQIPLDRLVSEAVVVDVTASVAKDPDFQVHVSDLRSWEITQGRQLVDVIVLIRTGYGHHWNDRERYLGTDEMGQDAVANLHFPGLNPTAAQWLVENRAINAIGIDTASIDHGQSLDFQTHVTLFEHNIPALENVANLDKLPLTGFTIFALPMKIGSGSGAPTRIVAMIHE